MKKLILFGDSLLANVNNYYASVIESKAGVEVYNCATSGWNTDDGAKKSRYFSTLKPDFILISFGTNDSGSRNPVNLEKFRENLQTISDNFCNTDRSEEH